MDLSQKSTIEKAAIIQSEVVKGNIPARKVQLTAIPYLGMSEGELELVVLKQRAEILEAYYGNEFIDYSKAQSLIENSLNAGLSNVNSFTGNIDDSVAWAPKAILKAKSKNKIIKPSYINFDFSGIKSDPVIRGIDALQSIDFLVYEEKVKDAFNISPGQLLNMSGEERTEFLKNAALAKAAFDVFKDKWFKQGHHILYNWLNKSSRKSTESIAKSSGHRVALDFMSEASTVPRGILETWTENGVMQCNVEQDAAPLTGGESVETYALINSFGSNGPSINDPVTIATITKIGTAIIAGLGVAKEVLTAIDDFGSRVRNYGFENYQPQGPDWPSYGSDELENQTSSFDLTNLFLIGGGALLVKELLK